jgi:putative oxidoreductase
MADSGKLVLRLALGILILLHGIAKLMGGIGGVTHMVTAIGLPGVLAWGVYVGEVIAPAMLLAGWYARIGALLIAVNMLFAMALAHRAELFSMSAQGGWALELQGMFLFAAVALGLLGPGRYSINGR